MRLKLIFVASVASCRKSNGVTWISSCPNSSPHTGFVASPEEYSTRKIPVRLTHTTLMGQTWSNPLCATSMFEQTRGSDAPHRTSPQTAAGLVSAQLQKPSNTKPSHSLPLHVHSQFQSRAHSSPVLELRFGELVLLLVDRRGPRLRQTDLPRPPASQEPRTSLRDVAAERRRIGRSGRRAEGASGKVHGLTSGCGEVQPHRIPKYHGKWTFREKPRNLFVFLFVFVTVWSCFLCVCNGVNQPKLRAFDPPRSSRIGRSLVGLETAQPVSPDDLGELVSPETNHHTPGLAIVLFLLLIHQLNLQKSSKSPPLTPRRCNSPRALPFPGAPKTFSPHAFYPLALLFLTSRVCACCSRWIDSTSQVTPSQSSSATASFATRSQKKLHRCIRRSAVRSSRDHHGSVGPWGNLPRLEPKERPVGAHPLRVSEKKSPVDPVSVQGLWSEGQVLESSIRLNRCPNERSHTRLLQV